MQCPIDGNKLVMSDKQGIEIDYCPECRGVWLDRGEIDKIVERSMGGYGGTPQPSMQQPSGYSNDNRQPHRDYDDDDDDDHRRHGSYDEHGGGKKHKRESFLGDLFG